MIIPRKFIFLISLLVTSVSAFAQNNKATTSVLEKKFATINSPEKKLAFLEGFLNDVKSNPGKFSKDKQSARDSVNNVMQLDYNVVLLGVFANSKTKTLVKIANATKKAYATSMQILNGDELTSQKQDQINQSVATAKALLVGYKFSN